MRISRGLAGCAALAGLLLSGCAALPGFKPAPLDTYNLTAPAGATAGRRLGRTQVLIGQPSALKSLDGQDIVIEPSPGTIEYLKGAQWSDRLPRVVQAGLLETFQRSGRLGGVGKAGEGLAIDYQVISDIRAFQISVGKPDMASIEIYVKVLNDRTGVVRASRTFTVETPVEGTGNDAFVAALDKAFGVAASQIAEWSISVM